MRYYDLRVFYKNGSTKTIRYSYGDFIKAYRHAHRLAKSCKLVYVVDGHDYRVCFEKNL